MSYTVQYILYFLVLRALLMMIGLALAWYIYITMYRYRYKKKREETMDIYKSPFA